MIRFHVNGYHLRKYLQDRRGWSDQVWQQIDFPRFSQHLKRLPLAKYISHLKFVHNQQYLGVRRFQQAHIKDDTLALCPCCTQVKEDQHHLLCCLANTGRSSGWAAFRKSALSKEDIHPFWHCIVEGVEHWFAHSNNKYMPDLSRYLPHVCQAMAIAARSQQNIG